MKDGAARDRELLAARLALEQAPGVVLADREAAAAGADWLAVGGVPSHGPEERERLFLAHAGDLDDGDRPRRCREEEVLGHFASYSVLMN